MFIQTYPDDAPLGVSVVHVVTNDHDGDYPFNEFYVFDDVVDADVFVDGLPDVTDTSDDCGYVGYSHHYVESIREYDSVDDAIDAIHALGLYSFDVIPT